MTKSFSFLVNKMFLSKYQLQWLTHIQNHRDENDQSKIPVECDGKEADRNQDVDDGRCNREQNEIEQIGDAVGASVHDPQNFTGFSA